MAKTGKGNPLLFIVIILAVVVGGGYYLVQSGKIAAPIPGLSPLAPRATEQDFAFIEDPLVRKHMAAQANVTSYRSRMHDLIATAGSFNVFEVQMRGNNVAYYNWREDSGKKNGELMTIGDTTYVKDYKDGAWWKQKLPEEEKPKNEDEGQREPTDFKDEYAQNRSMTYTKLAEEPCPNAESLTCYKYKENDSQNPEASRIFWFDKGKLLLRQEEAGFGEWRSRNTYEYDAINITAPSPTKDVPEGKNIYEYMYPGAAGNTSGMPTQQELDAMQQLQQQYQPPTVDYPTDATGQDITY